ncbi:MAG TPA: transposase [Solirubrobacterales bacterium]
MPRKPREEEAGAVQHVYARGNNKQRIFLRDGDRAKYLGLLGDVVERSRWRCLSYCLMDNHVHLMLETTLPNLGEGMQWLHGHYGTWLNEIHARVGHVFQGRFGAVRMKSEGQLWAAAAYIARNPVDAGLCELPEEWAWSSHRFVLEGDGPSWLDVDRLLWHFSGVGADPRSVYGRVTGGV